MSNKRCIPAELKDTTSRDAPSYKFMFDQTCDKISLHSYVVNSKSSGKKNVLALSSMPVILGTTKDDGKQKPAILKFYDFSKGGTDIIDQRMGNYSVNSMSPRWIMTTFAYLLDTARVNAQTIHSMNAGTDPRKSISFQFGWDLAIALVTPHIRSRKNSLLKKLNSKTLSKMNLILNDSEDDARSIEDQNLFPHPPISPKRNRCVSCIEALRNTSGAAKLYSKITALKTQCQCCGQSVCKQHSFIMCTKCHEKIKTAKPSNEDSMDML